ncbi:hypothetical protein SacmaDRAFT_5250 [Saccharomonospora marina XMU15]|uniref:Uncharacterized protein n=1 Tax=Saccharomonospora marina XMU15 TaxID=882083 RepID=H5X611_9PSEU|nr:hypothetical protein [Saccharomonospora marina]EHR53410.1 hypothetical protein SacmaDRAFT_5250 [Saccharomonospora marina XMU15]
MPYYSLEPAAPGELGERVVMDTSVHPPRVTHAHLHLDGWLSDDLIEAYPCYFVSETLAASLQESELDQYELRDVEVTISEDAPDDERATIPGIRWLFVTGTAGVDDLGTTVVGQLVVSDRGLAVLQQGNLDHCDIEDYTAD